jgi:hypothetical protein
MKERHFNWSRCEPRSAATTELNRGPRKRAKQDAYGTRFGTLIEHRGDEILGPFIRVRDDFA